MGKELNSGDVYRRACSNPKVQEEIRKRWGIIEQGWNRKGYVMYSSNGLDDCRIRPSLSWLLEQLRKERLGYEIGFKEDVVDCGILLLHYCQLFVEVDRGVLAKHHISDELAVLAALGKSWLGWTLKEDGGWEK